MSTSIITIPARSGKAAYVEAGQRIKVINTHGQQVVDTWAFRRDNLRNSCPWNTIGNFMRIRPRVGESFSAINEGRS